MNAIVEVASEFINREDIISINHVDKGKINTTYLICGRLSDYYLQKINGTVFEKPKLLMKNIELTLSCNGSICFFPELIKAHNGQCYYIHNKQIWRMYSCAGSSIDKNELSLSDYKNIGQTIGNLHGFLSKLRHEDFHTPIEKYHDLGRRYFELKCAYIRNTKKLNSQVNSLYMALLDREYKALKIENLLKNKMWESQIVHNDLTLNNLVYDSVVSEYKLVDLDTLMVGSRLYDLGEFLRNGAVSTNADGYNELDINKCKSVISGYMDSDELDITNGEVKLIPSSVWLMNLLLTIRYLTDYILGDIYFLVDYEDQNFYRALNKLHLLIDIENKIEYF